MSDDKNKKNEFEGSTFQKVLMETMHKGSMSHEASKLIESFGESQKEEVLKTVHHVSSIADRLNLLLSKLEDQEAEEKDV